MPFLSSTAISCVEYNPTSGDLNIWFVGSGGPYTYYGVPAGVYQALISAASAGIYFNAFIRDVYSSNR